MNMTVSQAYKLAKDIFENFCISACYELEDCWIFICSCTKSGEASFVPPLKVLKNGEDLEFWKKRFNNCFERGDWLRENGKSVSIEELEKIK